MQKESENSFANQDLRTTTNNYIGDYSKLAKSNNLYSLIIYDNLHKEDDNCPIQVNIVAPGVHITEALNVHSLQMQPLHQHNVLEIVYVLEGELIQQIENTSYCYSKGSCCFVDGNTRHRQEFNSNFLAVFLNITIGLLKDLPLNNVTYHSDGTFTQRESNIRKCLDVDNYKELEKAYLDFIPISSDTSHIDEIKYIFYHIMTETIEQKPGFIFMVQALLLRFISLLEDPSNYRMTHLKPNSNSDDFLFAQIAHLLESRHGRISRGELEQTLNYSGDYLNRVVKNHSGMTILDYGLNLCLQEASNLLQTTDDNISDIIEKMGFSNRTYFNKIFKEKYGMTPKEYRKNIK